jgi:hypothetical protein
MFGNCSEADECFQFYEFYHLSERLQRTGDKRGEPESAGGDNSPWSLIGGVAKYFRFSVDQILWGISYQNLNMLLATIPSYEEEEKKENVKEMESVDELASFLGMTV